MVTNILQVNWPLIQHDARAYWGKLRASDVDQINGDYGRLVQMIMNRYGYSRVMAEDEVDDFLFRYEEDPIFHI